MPKVNGDPNEVSLVEYGIAISPLKCLPATFVILVSHDITTSETLVNVATTYLVTITDFHDIECKETRNH